MEITEGDVFRWRYKEEFGDTATDLYWCRSCIAIAHKGKLFDTYWGDYPYDRTQWKYGTAIKDLNLTFLGNMNSFEKIRDCEKNEYDERDVLDTR